MDCVWITIVWILKDLWVKGAIGKGGVDHFITWELTGGFTSPRGHVLKGNYWASAHSSLLPCTRHEVSSFSPPHPSIPIICAILPLTSKQQDQLRVTKTSKVYLKNKPILSLSWLIFVIVTEHWVKKKWVIWNESFKLRLRLGRSKVSPENTFLTGFLKAIFGPQDDAVHVYCCTYLGVWWMSSPPPKFSLCSLWVSQVSTHSFWVPTVGISDVTSLSFHFALCGYYRCLPQLWDPTLWLESAAACSRTLCTLSDSSHFCPPTATSNLMISEGSGIGRELPSLPLCLQDSFGGMTLTVWALCPWSAGLCSSLSFYPFSHSSNSSPSYRFSSLFPEVEAWTISSAFLFISQIFLF